MRMIGCQDFVCSSSFYVFFFPYDFLANDVNIKVGNNSNRSVECVDRPEFSISWSDDDDPCKV